MVLFKVYRKFSILNYVVFVVIFEYAQEVFGKEYTKLLTVNKYHNVKD